MRKELAIAGLSLSWILLGTVSVNAQDQPSAGTTLPTITTDRPAITDASTVVPRGAVVFENGFTETGSQGQRSFDFPETLIRFGVSSKTELRFTAPDYFENFNSGNGFGSGRGDLILGMKQQLARSSGFDAALIVALSFPTGAKVISSHGYDPQVLLPWSHSISKNWSAAGMFALFWPTQGSKRNLTGQPSFLLDRQNTSRWDTFLEYAGDFPQRGGPQQFLHLGSAYKITSDQQLDLHIGFGLSAATADHFIGFGYSFQFPAISGVKHKKS